MFGNLFGKKPEEAPITPHGKLPSPIGLHLGAAIRLDSVLSKVLAGSGYILELPAPGTPMMVASQGLIDLGEGVKLHRFYLDDDYWLQVKVTGGLDAAGEQGIDEIGFFAFGDVLNPSTQAEFEEVATLIGAPTYDYADQAYERLWGMGKGLAAAVEYMETVYPRSEASFLVRHQDMLYKRAVTGAGTQREELLLVSTETDAEGSVSVVHNVGLVLSQADLEIT